MSMLRRLWAALSHLFWADADGRTYAIVRIGFSIAALANWVELFARRREFFGPRGLIDYRAVAATVGDQPFLSVFTYASTEGAITALFFGGLAGILSLGAGYRTRASALIVFLWHVSYSHVAFPILHGWDSLLRAYSLLILISPAPTSWSVDSWRWRRSGRALGVPPAYGLRLMQWQLFVIYWGTAWLKFADPNWRNGRLVAFFQMSMYSRFSDVTWLANHEIIANLLTYSSLAIEVGVVMLLASTRLRWMGLWLGVALHAGIALTAHLTTFSLCMLAPYGAFLTCRNIDTAQTCLVCVASRGHRGISAVGRLLARR